VTTTGDEGALLERARGGDERAFGELVEPYRRELHVHGYRMLGSPDDAEEAIQDTMLRAWRGLARFEGRSSLRTWLYRIATNVCLTRIERRPPRTLPFEHGPPSDPYSSDDWVALEAGWVEPLADAELQGVTVQAGPDVRVELRESVELAFLAALQHLPGTQRAVLLLRDVLGFSAKETAAALDTTVASVTSALQRARARTQRQLPDISQQATLRALGDASVRLIVERYVEAWERGDAAAILAMLADDAGFGMPPYLVWYRGRDDIAAFLPLGPLRMRWRVRPVDVNGQLAFGCYGWDEQRGRYEAHSIDVLTLRGGQITRITSFLEQDAVAFERLSLPAHLPSGEGAEARVD
jgi:RNA polymerase sigma-70 factor, ECF subfamily